MVHVNIFTTKMTTFFMLQVFQENEEEKINCILNVVIQTNDVVNENMPASLHVLKVYLQLHNELCFSF